MAGYKFGKPTRKCKRIPLADRLWAKTDKTSHPGGCWVWTGARSRGGYGRIGQPGRLGTMQAHRAAWEVTNGPIPDGLHACHKCDNRACVNPSHLFLGTRKDNMQDCKAKNRNNAPRPFGVRCHHAKLTPDIVRQVFVQKNNGVSNRQMAIRLSVSKSTIERILNRRTWKQVEL